MKSTEQVAVASLGLPHLLGPMSSCGRLSANMMMMKTRHQWTVRTLSYSTPNAVGTASDNDGLLEIYAWILILLGIISRSTISNICLRQTLDAKGGILDFFWRSFGEMYMFVQLSG